MTTSPFALQLEYEGRPLRFLDTRDILVVAKDACELLGLDTAVVARSVPEAEKGLRSMQTPGGDQEVTVLREAGLYRLVLRSRKPEARRFQDWLLHEVLPSIRKHGCYPPPKLEVMGGNHAVVALDVARDMFASLVPQIVNPIVQPIVAAICETRAEQRAFQHHVNGELTEIRQEVNHLSAAAPRRRNFSRKTQKFLSRVVVEAFNGDCPCCRSAKVVDGEGRITGVFDHWKSRSLNGAADGWLVCAGCNERMGPPQDVVRRKPHEHAFHYYQEQMRRIGTGPAVRQMRLLLPP